jgi:hypothetical protein
MSAKKTILWLVVASGLFAFIYFYQRHVRPLTPGHDKVLPELRMDAVTSVLIRPSGPVQLQIRADRTNGSWMLTQPLVYPAQAEKVKKLLAFLEQLRPVPYLTAGELRAHTNADEEFGFAVPQATLVIQQGPYTPRVRVGVLTNPGDQVFLQVEGDLGAYVVDAELMKYLPHSADDWRDTSLVNLQALTFDRIAVTNNVKGDAGRVGLPVSSSTFVLQRDPVTRAWRMVWPLDARANQTRIEEALRKLQELRIQQFVSDDPKSDLEPLGLLPAELELGFANGTNTLGLVQFGRSPTNNSARVYAHRAGQAGVFTVNKDLLLGWCAFLNDFRDPHLLSPAEPLSEIQFGHGEEISSIQRLPDGTWRSFPEDNPADPLLVGAFFSTLTNLDIIKFVNDVVNPADLPGYDLAPPLYRLVVKTSCASFSGDSTNTSVTELEFGFGTNLQDKVFAKRTDENFVYAISTNDFARFPFASWQLRDRVLCHFSSADVARATLSQGDKLCQMIHKGPLSWSFAPGSQGIINDGAIEETVRGVVQTAAIVWVDHGDKNRAAYGFTQESCRLTLELKNGGSFEIEFGDTAPSGNVYAAVKLDGQTWILEFPWMLLRDLTTYFPLTPRR